MSEMDSFFQIWGHHKRRREWEHLLYQFGDGCQRLLYVNAVEAKRQKPLHSTPVTLATGCAVRMPKGYDKFRATGIYGEVIAQWEQPVLDAKISDVEISATDTP